jgi:hypothetical protein
LGITKQHRAYFLLDLRALSMHADQHGNQPADKDVYKTTLRTRMGSRLFICVRAFDAKLANT